MRKMCGLTSCCASANIIRAFALHSYILTYRMILLADTEGPDQCADAQADLGLRCSHMPEDAISHGAAFMIVIGDDISRFSGY